MKVTIKYDPQDDEDDAVETSFTLTLPKAWLPGPTQKVRHLFVDQFNKKHSANSDILPLDKENCRLQNKKGLVLLDDTPVEQSIKENETLFVFRGKDAPVEVKKVEQQQSAPFPPTQQSNKDGSVLCKRFGCGKRFIKGQPSNEPCRHHKKPPVFHETRKYWACCPEKVAWDWEQFQTITGCEVVPEHSDVLEGNRKVMGGTELRADIQGPQEVVAEKKITGLDKLMNLRNALVSVGVKGDVFDTARDAVKRLHEDAEGKQVWDKVCSELAVVFQDSLNSVPAKCEKN